MFVWFEHLQVVELAGLSAEIINDIPQTATFGQLGRQHDNKLAPAGKRTKFLPDMVLGDEGLKFMSLENSYNLRKNGPTMGYGSEILIVIMVLTNAL
jgi:hypothetical protein